MLGRSSEEVVAVVVDPEALTGGKKALGEMYGDWRAETKAEDGGEMAGEMGV